MFVHGQQESSADAGMSQEGAELRGGELQASAAFRHHLHSIGGPLVVTQELLLTELDAEVKLLYGWFRHSVLINPPR